MSVCGWGSRELTSKQGTFPLIILLLLSAAGLGKTFPGASWVEKSFSVLIFASGKQGPELWCHVEGDSWRRKCGLVVQAQGRAGCSGLCVRPCCGFAALHQARVWSPPGITELQCDRGLTATQQPSCGLHTVQAP